MSYYLRVIESEDMVWTGENNNVLTGDITEYNNLRKIVRKHKNSTGRREERIIIHRKGGSREELTGHIVGSGLE